MAESSRWSAFSTGLLTVCALLVTAAVVRREFFPAKAPLPVDREVRAAATAVGVGHVMGPAGAPVTLLVFSDFQCPFCAVLQQTLERLHERHPDAVRVEYRHMPIESIHPFAFDAALASECAGAQGRFEAFHDLLFENQDSIPSAQWGTFARQADVADLPAFDRCVQTREFDARVRADVATARDLGVRGTPSVFVGTIHLGGTPSLSTLDSIVRAQVPSTGAIASSNRAERQP